MPEENLVKIATITPEQVAGICDHTFLFTTEYYKGKGAGDPIAEWHAQFNKFLEGISAMPAKPYAICVRPEEVEYISKYINYNSLCKDVKIAAVAGFPHGRFSTDDKLNHARQAMNAGASEIDFVLNYEKFKNGDMAYINNELKVLGDFRKYLKVAKKLILETSELTDKQIVLACKYADAYEFDFVKTSTGFSSAGAKPEHLRIMRENFPRGIKISGGVNPENYKELLQAASGRTDGYIDLRPELFRLGESSLLGKLYGGKGGGDY